jgi:hypothetical protein
MKYLALIGLALLFAVPGYAAEDLTHITGAGGTVYFAHDFESGSYTKDAGTTGSITNAGGSLANSEGTGCDSTSSYHNTIISTAAAGQGAVTGSTHSLITPYRGACNNESWSRDHTAIGLSTPIDEYYIRWYQKWTGSFQNSVQQKLVKFYNASDSQQTTISAYFTMEGAGAGATTGILAGFELNLDGYFNKTAAEFDPDFTGAYTPGTGLIWVHPIQRSATASFYNGRIESWDTDVTTASLLQFNLNQWYCIEIHSKMNTPTSSANGMVEMWVDGNLVFKTDNIRLRDGGTYNSPGTNNFELQSVYYNRSSSDQSTYMDNIVIANRYIGTLSGGGGVTTAGPGVLGGKFSGGVKK